MFLLMGETEEPRNYEPIALGPRSACRVQVPLAPVMHLTWTDGLGRAPANIWQGILWRELSACSLTIVQQEKKHCLLITSSGSQSKISEDIKESRRTDV